MDAPVSDAIRADDAARADLGAPYEQWDAFPTKAEVKAIGRRGAAATRAAARAAYRAQHPELNPHATDKTVDDLIYLQGWGASRRGGAPRDPR